MQNKPETALVCSAAVYQFEHCIYLNLGRQGGETMKLSLNSIVTVTLTDYGWELVRAHYENLALPDQVCPERPADNKWTTELWHVMRIVGPHLHIAMPDDKNPMVGVELDIARNEVEVEENLILPTLNPQLGLAARIEGTWRRIMHDVLGFRDFCESTTQFNYIDYSYTKDCPEAFRDAGQLLWSILLEKFGGSDNHGEVHWPKEPGKMNTVTRRRELWEK
jgi:hypothetical protein